MKNIIILSALIILSYPCVLVAQQEGIVNQITMNKLTLNPGYAGYRDKPTFSLAHRQQWVGFEGAPRTSILSYDKSAKTTPLGYGGSLIQSRVGPASKVELAGYTAIKLKLSSGARISWGANAGLQISQVNINGLRAASDLTGQQDELILQSGGTQVSPYAGFGFFLHNRTRYLAISIPKLITTKPVIGRSDIGNLANPNVRTVYIMGGGAHKLNKQVRLNMDGFFIGTWNSPVSIGGVLRAVYDEDYSFGVFYTYAQSAGVLFQMSIDRNIKLSYSLDLATNSMIRTNFGSHELGINYSISSKMVRITHPRYF